MRVAIIGGTGQVGLAAATCLANMNVETFILSRKNPPDLPAGIIWLPTDITDRESIDGRLQQVRPQRVANLAALLQFACNKHPRAAMDVNVMGALNILDACCRSNVDRLVFGSSIAVYGERSTLMREEDAIPPHSNLYALSKLMGEALGSRYQDMYGLRSLALRYSGIFGGLEAATPGMSQVRSDILKTASGKDITITAASGNELIHLTHVMDAAEATCSALLSPNPVHSIYNVAGPAENYISLRDYHGAIRAIRPRCGNVQWTGKAKSAGPVDTTRMIEDLKFVPRRTFADHVADLISHEVPLMS